MTIVGREADQPRIEAPKPDRKQLAQRDVDRGEAEWTTVGNGVQLVRHQ